jgi:hypothetical protein
MTLFTPLVVKRRHSNLHQRSPVAKCPGFLCQHRIAATRAKINKRLKLQKRHKLNMWLMIHVYMMRYIDIYSPSIALPAYRTLRTHRNTIYLFLQSLVYLLLTNSPIISCNAECSDLSKYTLFLFSKTSRPALRIIHPPIQWVPRVKQRWHEADHSGPSPRLPGVHSGNFHVTY